MSYCDFNPKLFRQFTSMKTKIEPAISDDWEIIPAKYRSLDGMMLYSEKLDQKVADIDLKRFLIFSKEQNLTIIGLKLQGNYIVGNNRSIYTEDMYKTWKDKFESRTETIIPVKDYKVGHTYSTPCGASYIYLGFRYVSKFKSYSFEDYTNIKKEHFVAFENPSYMQHKSKYDVNKLTQKLNKDFGETLSQEECDKLLEKEFNDNMSYVYFDKVKPKKLKEFDLELIKVSKNNQHCLIYELYKNYYISKYKQRHIKTSYIEKSLIDFNPNNMHTKGREISDMTHNKITENFMQVNFYRVYYSKEQK
jgi:hypothetical protein